MQAYAALSKVSPDFANHGWAVDNLKEEGKGGDFSGIWRTSTSDLDLANYDDALYFYGGRSAIYEALESYEDNRIRNFAEGHRSDPIRVFSAEVKTVLGIAKPKQIIMIAVANAKRERELAAFRDQALEGEPDAPYRIREFRGRMKKKWPGIETAERERVG